MRWSDNFSAKVRLLIEDVNYQQLENSQNGRGCCEIKTDTGTIDMVLIRKFE